MDGIVINDPEHYSDSSLKDYLGLAVIVVFLAVFIVASDGGVSLILGPVIALYGLANIVAGFRRWQTLRLVEDTIPEPVRSVAAGRTEVRGTCKPVDKPIQRPFSEGECILAFWKIEEYDDGWKTLDSGGRYTPFVIDDGTGSIRVEPTIDMTRRISEENTMEFNTGSLSILGRGSIPPAIEEFLDSHSAVDKADTGLLFRPKRRYTEFIIPPNEEGYVLGGATVRDDAEGSNADRLIISRHEGTDEFVIADQSQKDFARDDRTLAIGQIKAGLYLIVGFTVMLVVLDYVFNLAIPLAP